MQAKIFISYSRRNKDFTQKLFDALKAHGYDSWVDWDDIPFSVDWWQEIQESIDEHDVFIIVVSNASMTSRVVSQEIKYARELNKRIIPVIAEKVDVKYMVGELYDQPYEMDARDNWKYIRTLNWIYFYREEDDFDEAVNGILSAIEIDHTYLREHTRILNRAQEWMDNERGKGFLLMGEELAEAEKWLSRAEDQRRMPMPTSLHRQYIETSREVEDDQKAQIDAMRRQTRLLRGATALLIITGVIVISAILFALQTQQDRNATIIAERDTIQTQSANIQTESAQSLETQAAAEATFSAQSTQAAQSLQILRTESAQALADQLALVEEIELARQQSESLRLASEAENALENGDPNLFSIPLALAAHRVVENGRPPLRVGRILANAGYRPGLVRLYTSSDDVRTAHDATILAVAVSRDGSRVISASQDRTVRVWEVASGDLLHTLEGHASGATAVAISTDGSQVASGDSEGTIILWDIGTQTILHRIDAHAGRVTDLAFSPDGTQIVSTSADNTVRVWGTEDGTALRIVDERATSITQVAYHPDGSELITGDANGRIVVWNADTFILRRNELRHSQNITDIAYNADGSLVLTSSADGRFILWRDFDNGDRVVNDDLRGRTINAIDFANDDTALIGMASGELLLWDLSASDTNPGPLRSLLLPGEATAINALATNTDGRYVISAYDNNRLALWEIANGANHAQAAVTNFPVTSAAAAAEDSIVFRYQDPATTFALWDGDENIITKTRDSLGVSSAILHPDGQTMLARTSADDTLVRMNITTEAITTRYDLDINLPGTVISPDGTRAFSSASLTPAINAPSESLGASTVPRVIWNIDTGEVERTFEGLAFNLTEGTTTFNRANTRLALVNNLQTLVILDTQNGEVLNEYERGREVTAVTFARNNTIVTGYADGGIALLKPEDDGEWREFRTHTDRVLGLATSPNGQFVISGSADGSIVVWDVETVEAVREFAVITGGVNGVLFLPGNEYFLSRSTDGVVNLWRLDTDDELTEWVTQNRFVVSFSPSDCRTFQIPDPCP